MSTAQLHHDAENTAAADAATAIDMNTRDLIEAAIDPRASPTKLTGALLAVGLLTLAMDLAAALYKPPRGQIFERCRLAYYLIIAGIFAAGAAEVAIAFWLSYYAQEGRRRIATALVRALLCASLLPLVLVVALGGFSVLIRS
ncbi:hypothetical protein PVAP13_4KG036000 [Panicum virgatum]|uniref:Uncharacterized protein n=1 Tax=Panicum virgatum TaxID=38727 RepID=A0A8T0TGL6_PANVG|nr:hypothetical protein PVAP13_4KG036000 [Panicum virgatum]